MSNNKKNTLHQQEKLPSLDPRGGGVKTIQNQEKYIF
jgi:hypothetical protein